MLLNLLCARVIGIVGKIAIVMIMMAIAICMYRNKYKKWTMVPFIFAFYILAVSISLRRLTDVNLFLAGRPDRT